MRIKKPLSHYVLVRIVEPESGSVLVIPEAVKAGLGMKYAEVIQTHDTFINMQGAETKCPVEVGDTVLFLAMMAAPLTVKHDDKEYVLIPSNAIAAIIEDFEETVESNIVMPLN